MRKSKPYSIRCAAEWGKTTVNHIERRGRCPNCRDRSGHLYQNEQTLCWICFKCGERGRGELPEVEWIARRTMPEDDRPLLTADIVPISDSELTDDEESYLTSHHISRQSAEQFLYTRESQPCLIAPTRDASGRIICLTERRFRNQPKHYLSGQRAWCLFSYVREHPRRIVVVESPFSVLRLASLIDADTALVATFGKHVTMGQFHMLDQLTSGCHTLIWFDAIDGLPQAIDLCLKLKRRGGRECRICIGASGDRSGKDPCDYSDDAARELLNA